MLDILNPFYFPRFFKKDAKNLISFGPEIPGSWSFCNKHVYVNICLPRMIVIFDYLESADVFNIFICRTWQIFGVIQCLVPKPCLFCNPCNKKSRRVIKRTEY